METLTSATRKKWAIALLVFGLAFAASCGREGRDTAQKQSDSATLADDPGLRHIDARLAELRLLTRPGASMNPENAFGSGANSVAFTELVATDSLLAQYVDGVGVFVRKDGGGHVAPLINSGLCRTGNDVLFMELFLRDRLTNIRRLTDYLSIDGFSHVILVVDSEVTRIRPGQGGMVETESPTGKKAQRDIKNLIEPGIHGFSAREVFETELIYEYLLYHFDESPQAYARTLANVVSENGELARLCIGPRYTDFIEDLTSALQKGSPIHVTGGGAESWKKNCASGCHCFEIRFEGSDKTYAAGSLLSLGCECRRF